MGMSGNIDPSAGQPPKIGEKMEGLETKKEPKEFRLKGIEENEGSEKDFETATDKISKQEPEKIKIKLKELNEGSNAIVVDRTLDLIIKDMSMQVAEIKEVKDVSAIPMASRIDAINQLIVDNVAKVYASEEGAIIILKTDEATNVPDLFKGSEIHLSRTDAGLEVNFTLAEGVSEDAAAALIMQNASQLQLLAEKVQLHKMRVGGTEIVLSEIIAQPEIAPIRRPFEAEAGRQQRDQGQGQGQQKGKQGEEK